HKKTIYFLQGHGERSIDDEKDELSVFGFRQLLEKQSYTVKTINLASSLSIPNDATTLVIAGPKQQFQVSEIISIEEYLNTGHSLMLLLDEKETYGLGPLLKKLGVELQAPYVFNVFDSPMGPVLNPQAPTVAVEYSPTDEITRVFGNNQMTVFRNPHALKLLNNSTRIQTEVLVRTPKDTVAISELDSQDYSPKQQFDLGVRVRGRLNANASEFSAVVFGDVDFVSNILLYQNINRDLALNSISYLTKENDLISISAKEPLATKMLISPPEFSQFFKFTLVGLFIPLPIALMILSLVLWYRRRHA
ncbi:MAG: GldG family protein, partial [Bdellovibrionaceae bacterium]|nr:GldG family protein [Pseudobdellovibrionaceae bacterium]